MANKIFEAILVFIAVIGICLGVLVQMSEPRVNMPTPPTSSANTQNFDFGR